MGNDQQKPAGSPEFIPSNATRHIITNKVIKGGEEIVFAPTPVLPQNPLSIAREVIRRAADQKSFAQRGQDASAAMGEIRQE